MASIKQDYPPLTLSASGKPKALAECMMSAIDELMGRTQRVDLRLLPNDEANIITHVDGFVFSVYEFRNASDKTEMTTWNVHRVPKTKISDALSACAKTA